MRTSAKSTLIRPGRDDQVGDALHRAQQHVVRGAEGLDHRGVAAEHGDQLLVRDGDQRIAVLAEFLDALQRHLHAATAFERERLGDHRDGQDAHLLGELRDDGRRARAGAAAHAGGDEHHVGALQGIHDAFAIFQRGLAADFGIRARAQALGDVAAELQLQLGAAVLDRLRVGVRRDEFHAVHAAVDHVRHGVAAAAAHADDLDHCIRGHLFNQFEMRHVRVLVIGAVLCTATTFLWNRLPQKSISSPCRPCFSLRSELAAVPVLQLVEEAARAAGRDRRTPRVLDLAAHQQQADARGMHRVADHFAEAGDVLRDADAHRHLQHFLGQLDDAFHLRSAAGEHHAGAHVLFEAAAAQFGLHHLEDFLVARLHRLRERMARQAARRTIAHARHLDAFLGRGQLRERAGVTHLDLLGFRASACAACARCPR